MQELLVKEDVKIENIIYEFRGKQVMLDSDLANLANKLINELVRKNREKFPYGFPFCNLLFKLNILEFLFEVLTIIIFYDSIHIDWYL